MRQRAARTLHFLLANSCFLIIGTVSALIWANTDHHGYEHFHHSAHFLVNDILMVFFFGIAVKEIWEAMLPGGPLSSPRKAATPVIATLGGVIGPAAFYVAGCHFLGATELVKGWAIPTATDIAFCYLFAKIIFGDHPAVPFLLLLAIVDDAIGLTIIAVFYSGELQLLFFFGMVAAAVIVNLMLRRFGVQNFWPYLIFGGTISWWGFYIGGIHPALALVPVIPTMPHGKKDAGLYEEVEEMDHPTEGATSLEEAKEHEHHDALNQFEHWWKNPVELILLAFGLTNAGVVLNTEILTSDGALLVASALLVGKPIGIFLCGFGATRIGLKLPDGMDLRHLWISGALAGIGFTVAIFVSTVAFPEGGYALDSAKTGALFSFAGALLGGVSAVVLGIKPVRPPADPEDENEAQVAS